VSVAHYSYFCWKQKLSYCVTNRLLILNRVNYLHIAYNLNRVIYFLFSILIALITSILHTILNALIYLCLLIAPIDYLLRMILTALICFLFTILVALIIYVLH